MHETRLESERIWLKPLSLGTLEAIGDARFDALDTPVEAEALSADVLSAIQKKIVRMRDAQPAHHPWHTYWLIVSRETGRGIGFAGFKGIDDFGFAEVGYSISPLHRKKGLMTEALKALICWAEKTAEVRGVTAKVNPRNAGSAKVLQRAGFSWTGLTGREDLYCIHFKEQKEIPWY